MNYRVQIRNWATLAAADVLMFVLNLGLLIASLVTGKTTATLVGLLAVSVSIWATAVAVRGCRVYYSRNSPMMRHIAMMAICPTSSSPRPPKIPRRIGSI